MRDNPWIERLRERLAADGAVPSAHGEVIEEIAEHLQDIHRGAIAAGHTEASAEAIVEAELAGMGPLASVVAARARRKARALPHSEDWRTGLAADFRHALRAIRLQPGFSAVVVV